MIYVVVCDRYYNNLYIRGRAYAYLRQLLYAYSAHNTCTSWKCQHLHTWKCIQGPISGWKNFLKVLSIRKSTPWSIGLTIKGILASPMAVVVHFLIGRLNFLFLLKRNNDRAQSRLIVNPGIATDARVCQIRVSAAAIIFRFWFWI